MSKAKVQEKATVKEIAERYPRDESSLVMILQDIQTEYSHLPREMLREVSKLLHVPLAKVFGVATFYRAFSLTPRGRHQVKVCKGTACHVRGAQLIQNELERSLKIQAGDTTPDGLFSIEIVNCVGACAMAPVVVVDEDYHPEVRPDRVKRILRGYDEGE
jgi:NADH:ubiquinone oxidoreductase subunit E